MKKKTVGILLALALTLLIGSALASGVLEGNWERNGGRWVCYDQYNRPVTNYRGWDGVRIPAGVDSLLISDFAGASRRFVIYCEPGSYAESFALDHGLQFDTGARQVIGYQISNVSQKVEWIISNYISSDMSDGKKAKVLHNWLVFNNFYDLSLTKGDIKDVLLYGTGVCQAYADAYALLLTKVGVENRTLISTTEMNHIWNVVKLGGRWVHIDATWDDPIDERKRYAISGEECEDYYGLSDGAMAQDHDWEEPVYVDSGNVGFVNAFGHTYYYLNGVRLTGWATLVAYDHVYSRWADGYVMTSATNSYYFDENGDMATDWRLVGGNMYYFRPDGAWEQRTAPQGWMAVDDGYYYIVGNAALTGWNALDGIWYYFGTDGLMATGWNQIGADWYYFNEQGTMITGWMEVRDRSGQSRWYYLKDSGIRAAGWLEMGGVWYYFDGEGIMATGLQQVGGATYFFQGSGAMTTGWAQLGGRWYYLKDSGAAAVGWEKIDGVWYYFDYAGVMQTGTQIIDGVQYSFDASGAWVQ